MGFARQEYWSGLSFPSPGDLLNPGIKPWSPELQVDSLPSEPRSGINDTNLYHLTALEVKGPTMEVLAGWFPSEGSGRESISLPFPLSRDHFSPWLVVPILHLQNQQPKKKTQQPSIFKSLSFTFASIHVSLPTLTSLPPYGLLWWHCIQLENPVKSPHLKVLTLSVKSLLPCKLIDSLVWYYKGNFHILRYGKSFWLIHELRVNLNFILTITVC